MGDDGVARKLSFAAPLKLNFIINWRAQLFHHRVEKFGLHFSHHSINKSESPDLSISSSSSELELPSFED